VRNPADANDSSRVRDELSPVLHRGIGVGRCDELIVLGIYATASDGTKIPLSIVYKKPLVHDSKRPMLL
jgi:prolyl oligopeptidase PreP (S9A serine peptidase family)